MKDTTAKSSPYSHLSSTVRSKSSHLILPSSALAQKIYTLHMHITVWLRVEDVSTKNFRVMHHTKMTACIYTFENIMMHFRQKQTKEIFLPSDLTLSRSLFFFCISIHRRDSMHGKKIFFFSLQAKLFCMQEARICHYKQTTMSHK